MIGGRIGGVPALQAELATLPDRLRDNLPDALQALAQRFRQRMRTGDARRRRRDPSRLETSLTDTSDSVVAIVSGISADVAGARISTPPSGLRGALANRRRAFRAPLGSGQRGANLIAALSDASDSAESTLSPALADALVGGGAS
jgi:hypothetical protein